MINSISNKSHILFLTGFMGSGKTTLGRELSNYLKARFFDLDTELQIGEGMNISTIFNQKGEEHFRTLESKYLRLVPLNQSAVIALGGGCFINKDNQNYINSHGTSIFIDVSFEIIWTRLKTNSGYRPLANNMDKNMLKSLYDQRYISYKLSDKHFIFNPNLSNEEHFEYILKLLI